MDTEPVADDLTPIRTAPGVVITRLGRPHSAPAQPVDPAHRLVWAAGSGLVARVGADQVGVRAPFGLWAPAGIAVDISSDDELREIWFDPATCPLGWSRVERPLLDGVGDELLAIGAPERTSVVRDAAQRVVDRLLDWFVAVEPPLRLPSDPRAREVAAAVMAEPGLDRDLLRWSELVGTSERTLRRLFSGETGLSFRRWQHTVRMTHAARLLADGVPVAVVANRTGYASVRSFRSGFRTMWGRRPEDVRSGPPASPSTLGWPLDVRSWPDDRTPGRHDPLAPLVNQTSREDVDMIRGAAGAMLVAAAFVLAACGGDGDDDGAGDATTTAEPTTAAEPTVDSSAASTARPSETSDTKIFVDSLGREVEVPVAPQRIVSGDSFNIIPQVLSLGGPLVGVPDETDDNVAVTRYYADELSSIERTGAQFEPNVEQIAALDPDLIIWGAVDTGFVGGLEGDTLQRLEGIAPVVAINHFQAIEDMMDHYAELLGPSANESVDDLQAEFEGALARLEEAFAPVRDELELAAVLAYDGGQDVFGTDFFLVQDIWTRLDANWVEVMDDADATDDRILSISEEEVERLESDLLVVLADPVNQLLDSPVYENLEVVQSGQVLVLDDSVFGQHYEAYVDLIETYREYLETTELRTDIVG